MTDTTKKLRPGVIIRRWIAADQKRAVTITVERGMVCAAAMEFHNDVFVAYGKTYTKATRLLSEAITGERAQGHGPPKTPMSKLIAKTMRGTRPQREAVEKPQREGVAAYMARARGEA